MRKRQDAVSTLLGRVRNPSYKEIMRRHLIGAMALLLILGAAYLWIWPQGHWSKPWEAGCWRMAILLSVFWLAYPDVRRTPPWFWAILPALLLILVWRPRWFLFLIPPLLLLAVLRPRRKK
jgi:hypothetical protein